MAQLASAPYLHHNILHLQVELGPTSCLRGTLLGPWLNLNGWLVESLQIFDETDDYHLILMNHHDTGESLRTTLFLSGFRSKNLHRVSIKCLLENILKRKYVYGCHVHEK